jgi:hypothetical protein
MTERNIGDVEGETTQRTLELGWDDWLDRHSDRNGELFPTGSFWNGAITPDCFRAIFRPLFGGSPCVQ